MSASAGLANPMSREELLAQLPQRLRQRRGELAMALSTHLHQDSEGEHAEAGLPRRADETDDDAAAETARSRDLAEVARLAAELTLVDAALARIVQGQLGDCVDCAEPIHVARLQVNPAAARCAECQEFVEQQQARARLRGR